MAAKDWATYWRDVCAPRMLAKKRDLGRGFPEREIASFVEARTGKPSGRALVWLWLHGQREPFISQFLALCEKLELNWVEVLTPVKQHAERKVLRRSVEGRMPSQSSRTAKKQRFIS